MNAQQYAKQLVEHQGLKDAKRVAETALKDANLVSPLFLYDEAEWHMGKTTMNFLEMSQKQSSKVTNRKGNREAKCRAFWNEVNNILKKA